MWATPPLPSSARRSAARGREGGAVEALEVRLLRSEAAAAELAQRAAAALAAEHEVRSRLLLAQEQHALLVRQTDADEVGALKQLELLRLEIDSVRRQHGGGGGDGAAGGEVDTEAGLSAAQLWRELRFQHRTVADLGRTLAVAEARVRELEREVDGGA